MKTLTKLWMQHSRALPDLWVEEEDDDDNCGLIIQAYRADRAVHLIESVVAVTLKKAKALLNPPQRQQQP
ncbi:hypothetical protein ColTof4_01098 [Colletotrichum tofieldiae]|nr:hypothetical protein ColTof4_01098 [Colletotrichum tofieldiae]